LKSPLDRAALAREITALANGQVVVPDGAVDGCCARRIAITGSPGAGKSTLSAHLARLRAKDQRYGILAVDPSSPKSGGAILGDRIRIDELDGTSDLYVRSLGSRNSNDGLADNLPAILETMDRHLFDEVILETVGVGQADYAVRALVDTVVLVLHPESGDIVQAMKAGIMEMADLFVMNKSDLPAAEKSAGDIKRVLSITHRDSGEWEPRVINTSSKNPESIVRLSEAIDAHRAWLDAQGSLNLRAKNQKHYVLRRSLAVLIDDAISRLPETYTSLSIAEQRTWILSNLEND